MEEGRFRIPWEEREKDFKELNLPLWEVTILNAYSTVLEDKVNSFEGALSNIEAEFKEIYKYVPTKVKIEEVKDTDRVNWQLAMIEAIRLFHGWGSVALSDFEQLLKGLSVKAKGWLNRKIADAIRWLTNKLVNFFKNFASHLKVQGWSVGGSFGFPSVAITIGINFEPK